MAVEGRVPIAPVFVAEAVSLAWEAAEEEEAVETEGQPSKSPVMRLN